MKKQMITKRMLIKRFGTAMRVAKILGITRGALVFWKLDDPIPAKRLLQLKALYPHEFGEPRPIEQDGFIIDYKPKQEEARI